MRLFLFDIDGTLIWAHGVGRIALTKAMIAVYGTPPAYAEYDTRGKTDPRIVFDVMHAAGVPDDVIYARLPSCFEAYVRHLDVLIDDGHPVQAMPGIPELVRALSAREDSLVGLLTATSSWAPARSCDPQGSCRTFGSAPLVRTTLIGGGFRPSPGSAHGLSPGTIFPTSRSSSLATHRSTWIAPAPVERGPPQSPPANTPTKSLPPARPTFCSPTSLTWTAPYAP